MITLNDYLYSGDTVLKILHRYHNDLKEDAKKTQNGMDMIHCNFLLQLMDSGNFTNICQVNTLF